MCYNPDMKEQISYEKHAKELQEMLDSMVDVLSSAIDALTPYNGNHTRNMCKYGRKFLEWMNDCYDDCLKTGREDPEVRYHRSSEAEIRRFLLAVQLHDVGKLVTPLQVMNKKTRLGGYEQRVFGRLRLIGALDRVAFLEGRMDQKTYDERKAQLEKARAFVEEVDPAGALPEGASAYIKELAQMTYIDEQGEEMPWFDPIEIKKLSIRKGTLTYDERKTMEKHVQHTARLLSEMKFPEDDWEVPVWAADHHEMMDGSGYPAKKQGAEIDWHVRLLTILDVFDALTARDRPYKRPTEITKSLGIMQDMAADGKLDGMLVDLFRQSKCWREDPEEKR